MPLRYPQWPQDALPRGTMINGYRIDGVLGRGGFGITYRAVDLLDQFFALKEFYPQQFARGAGESVTVNVESDKEIFEDCRQRFLREARLLSGFGRDGGGDTIVRVVTCFEVNNTAYSVMEMLAGETLEDRLKREPAGLPSVELTTILNGILVPLARVHAAGILHRDIKPSNIILRPDGRSVLIDFGSARDFGPSANTTYTQIFSGGYAPVEQMVGSRQGPFSDIYSVGAVAYRGIGGTLIDAVTRHQAALSKTPDPLKAAAEVGNGRYPPRLLGAIDRALAVAAPDRPQRVEDLLPAVEDCADTRELARPRTVSDQAPASSGRTRPETVETRSNSLWREPTRPTRENRTEEPRRNGENPSQNAKTPDPIGAILSARPGLVYPEAKKRIVRDRAPQGPTVPTSELRKRRLAQSAEESVITSSQPAGDAPYDEAETGGRMRVWLWRASLVFVVFYLIACLSAWQFRLPTTPVTLPTSPVTPEASKGPSSVALPASLDQAYATIIGKWKCDTTYAFEFLPSPQKECLIINNLGLWNCYDPVGFDRKTGEVIFHMSTSVYRYKRSKDNLSVQIASDPNRPKPEFECTATRLGNTTLMPWRSTYPP